MPALRLLAALSCLSAGCAVAPDGGPRDEPAPPGSAGGADAGWTAPAGPGPMRADRLDRELRALVDDPDAPVVAVAALAVRDGRVVYANQFGHRHLGDGRGEPPLPVTARTLYRVASISKLVVAVAAMRMVEQGLLALDDDVSVRLGWPLRHPRHPDRPITLRLLLTHRSGLADGGERYVFDGQTRLADVLRPGAALYADGLNWSRGTGPGDRFEYVNLNFGVVATLMECAAGERFDRLMDRLVLRPLGLRGGFDPSRLAAEDLADVAAQYRRRREDGGRARWDPQGPWVVQADDFRHGPPAPPEGLAGYEIGANGTLFGPQGRLRTDVASLGVLMKMLLDEGRHEGLPFLQPASVRLLATEQWRGADADGGEGAGRGAIRAWALGGQRFTDHSGPGRGDRLVEGGGFTGWGHFGDAYGLMGLFAIDPVARQGLVVLITGPGRDPDTQRGRWSAMTRWQETAVTAVARHALGRTGRALEPAAR